MTLESDQIYTVANYPGVAFHYEGQEEKDDEDTEWSGIKVETGNVLMRMVGDDRLHVVDPVEVTPLDEDTYCPACGQIGCAAYANRLPY